MAALDRVRGRLKDPEAPATTDPQIGARLAELSAFLEDPMLARMLTIQVRPGWWRRAVEVCCGSPGQNAVLALLSVAVLEMG